MDKLKRDDLMSLEQYAEARDEFRDNVLAHKRNRRLELGTNAALYFEDRLTMQYQVQEMLRIERIFEAAGIADELDAYNPLIPDGSNWKATFMIEFPDVDERRAMLQQLHGIEDRVRPRSSRRGEDLGRTLPAVRTAPRTGRGAQVRSGPRGGHRPRCLQCRDPVRTGQRAQFADRRPRLITPIRRY
jgi:hypothetical protein